MTGRHDARERLVAAAEGLLARSGPRSVSMDAAATAAGAGKMSAYRHFASKEDLLAAALDRHDPRHVRWLTGSDAAGSDAAGSDAAGGDAAGGDAAGGDAAGSDAAGGDAAGSDAAGGGGAAGGGAAGGGAVARILGVFDRVEAAAGHETFRGCPFVAAVLARSETDERPVAITARHKDEVARVLAELAAQAGLAEPGELGADLALVLDGAVVQAALATDPAYRRRIVRRGRRVAEVLLAAAGSS
jgi:AcrR family transcriptional regulator